MIKKQFLSCFKNIDCAPCFDLQSPLQSTRVRLVLYIFNKAESDTTIGIFNKSFSSLNEFQSKKVGVTSLPDYPESYLQYLAKIGRFFDFGELGEDSVSYQFNTIKLNQYHLPKLSPIQYSKDVFRIQEALKNETTIPLCEVADLICPIPDPNSKHTAYSLKAGAWNYPLDYSALKYGVLTNTSLHRGDIIFLNSDKYYLIDEDPTVEIHASPAYVIIRPTKISPVYLALYLNSETAKIIIESYSNGSIIKKISARNLRDIPVIKPTLSEDKYKEFFTLHYYKQSDISSFYKSLLGKYDSKLEPHSSSTDNVDAKLDVPPKVENIGDILSMEFVSTLKTCKQNSLNEFLTQDFRELNICYKSKAFKATLILAGSILEAVLIDWLSEKHGKNYFEKDYRVIGYNGKYRVAGLADYINAINEIEMPNWLNEADKSHEIREKRNLVHAKLCLKSNEINEPSCKKVIEYLIDVLKTRGFNNSHDNEY